MPAPLVTGVLVGSLLLAAWGAAAAAVDRPPGTGLLKAMFALQALLFAQLGVALYLVGGGERPPSLATTAGYVVLSLLLLPGGLAWSAQERSRWSSAVLGAACATVAVVELRLDATW